MRTRRSLKLRNVIGDRLHVCMIICSSSTIIMQISLVILVTCMQSTLSSSCVTLSPQCVTLSLAQSISSMSCVAGICKLWGCSDQNGSAR